MNHYAREEKISDAFASIKNLGKISWADAFKEVLMVSAHKFTLYAIGHHSTIDGRTAEGKAIKAAEKELSDAVNAAYAAANKLEQLRGK